MTSTHSVVESVVETIKQYDVRGMIDVVKVFAPIKCDIVSKVVPTVPLAVLLDDNGQVIGVLTDVGLVRSIHPFPRTEGDKIVAGPPGVHAKLLELPHLMSRNPKELRGLLDQVGNDRYPEMDTVQYVVSGKHIVPVQLQPGASNRMGRYLKSRQSARPYNNAI